MTDVFYGDWMKLRMGISRLTSSRAMDNAERQLLSIGNEVNRRVRRHIERQDLGWVPLKSSTIKKKGFNKIYMRNADFMGSITVSVERKADTVEMTVYPEGTHYSGLPMQELADYLEYGTADMRARPLWRPVFAEIENMKRVEGLAEAFGEVFMEGI